MGADERGALTTIAFGMQVDGLGAHYSSTEAKKEMIVLGLKGMAGLLGS